MGGRLHGTGACGVVGPSQGRLGHRAGSDKGQARAQGRLRHGAGIDGRLAIGGDGHASGETTQGAATWAMCKGAHGFGAAWGPLPQAAGGQAAARKSRGMRRCEV